MVGKADTKVKVYTVWPVFGSQHAVVAANAEQTVRNQKKCWWE